MWVGQLDSSMITMSFNELLIREWHGNLAALEHTWHLEYGTWHLAPGTWNLAYGTWHLEPGIWHLAHGAWQLATCTWNLVPKIN